MKKLLVTMLSLIFFITWPAFGQVQYEKVSGFHEHDGFFLRFHLGFGSGKMVEQDLPGGDMTLTGLTSNFRFQIGASIAENLVLFGELGAFVMSDPKMDWGSVSNDITGMNLSISDIGAGLTYYFMPGNIYISGGFTISRDKLEMRNSNLAANTGTGPGVYLAVGKEWWVAADWGLGVAGFYYFSTMNDKEVDSAMKYPINNSVLGIVFSATYQ